MSDVFIGEIRAVAFDFAPRGWAICDGSLIPIQQNTALFSLLKTTFGGDGVRTFGLPDYRGRSPVGNGRGPGLSPVQQGEAAGSEQTTLMPSQMPAHTHVVVAQNLRAVPKAFNGPGGLSDPQAAVFANAASESNFAQSTFAVNSGELEAMAPLSVEGSISIGVSGGNTAVPLRSPYLGTLYLIATEGIYPAKPE